MDPLSDPPERRIQAPDSVSVIIPTLNERDYLPALLDTLERQTVAASEVLVVDANSTDGTPGIAESYGARVIPDGGLPGFSRNEGAKVARGEWLLFLDADLELEPTAIEEALGEARRKKLDALSCWFIPDDRGWSIRFNHWFSSLYFWLSTKVGWAHSIGGFLFVRRSLHEEIGGFDSTITVAEDQDYVLRLGKAGRYAFTRRPVVQISTRRFAANGTLSQSFKWLAIETHRLFRGEIRHDDFHYFGALPSPRSVVSKGLNRIRSSRAAGRNVAGHEGDSGEE